MYKLKAMRSKSALHKLKNKHLPYQYDLNIYRGCSHNCIYCYARYMKQYSKELDYEHTIYAKTNIAKVLDSELSKLRDESPVLNLGGVTDSYQESEKTAGLMPSVLKVIKKYRVPIVICTKSDLILRDIELIDDLSKVTRVNVATSISTVDKDLALKLEPGAPSPQARLKMIQVISENTNAMTGVHLFPILPKLTDGYEQLKRSVESSHRSQADYLMLGSLYFNKGCRGYYLNAIKQINPNIYSETLKLYQSGRLDLRYKKELYKMIASIKEGKEGKEGKENKEVITCNSNEVFPFKLSAEEAIEWLKKG